MLRLIRKWLKVGVVEEGKRSAQEIGTPQGSVISSVLAKIYLHYAQDLWGHQWRKRHASGDVIIVRYVDDSVVGFQYKNDAQRFWKALIERMGKFGLELLEKLIWWLIPRVRIVHPFPDQRFQRYYPR